MKVLIADKLAAVGLDWLKEQKDVELDVKPGLPPAELAKIDRPVYLMYITRPGWYPAEVRDYDARLQPVHQITVDGGVILKILRLK